MAAIAAAHGPAHALARLDPFPRKRGAARWSLVDDDGDWRSGIDRGPAAALGGARAERQGPDVRRRLALQRGALAKGATGGGERQAEDRHGRGQRRRRGKRMWRDRQNGCRKAQEGRNRHQCGETASRRERRPRAYAWGERDGERSVGLTLSRGSGGRKGRRGRRAVEWRGIERRNSRNNRDPLPLEAAAREARSGGPCAER